ncbi:MAG: D-alanine--D-alanine ligase [Pseudomonadota bacterium]
MLSKTRVLHLVGSPTDKFYYDLSLVYARDCIEALTDERHYEFDIALVTPHGDWKFPRALDERTIDSTEAVSMSEAIFRLSQSCADVALPQMFCKRGMTDYRAMLSVLGIPIIGNPSNVMALAADKAKTKAVVAAAGVRVPAGQLISRNEQSTICLPAIVKPNDSDNSVGVRLVNSDADLQMAINEALNHSDDVLVEEYIKPGREVRCGIVECGEELRCLPLQEYEIDQQFRPIRGYNDKLTTNTSGALDLASKFKSQSWIVEESDPINEIVWAASRACHRALGCHDYSLFDFRIDDKGRPWFLEAGLYCSFAPRSILATMVAATGVAVDRFFQNSLEQVLNKSSFCGDSNHLQHANAMATNPI